MPPTELVLPWAPRRWITPVPTQASASTSLLREVPGISEADREPLHLEDLVGLAVAMDVVSTHTKSLTAGATILADLCERLRTFAHLGSSQDEAEALLALAKSPAGRARALLAQRLSRLLAQREDAAGALAQGPLASPQSVAAAVRRVEAAAALLIREAILRLAAKDVLDYRPM